MGLRVAVPDRASIEVYELLRTLRASNTVCGVVWSGVGWIGGGYPAGLAAIAASLNAGVQAVRLKTILARALRLGVRCSNIYLGCFSRARAAFAIQQRTFRERHSRGLCRSI